MAGQRAAVVATLATRRSVGSHGGRQTKSSRNNQLTERPLLVRHCTVRVAGSPCNLNLTAAPTNGIAVARINNSQPQQAWGLLLVPKKHWRRFLPMSFFEIELWSSWLAGSHHQSSGSFHHQKDLFYSRSQIILRMRLFSTRQCRGNQFALGFALEVYNFREEWVLIFPRTTDWKVSWNFNLPIWMKNHFWKLFFGFNYFSKI